MTTVSDEKKIDETTCILVYFELLVLLSLSFGYVHMYVLFFIWRMVGRYTSSIGSSDSPKCMNTRHHILFNESDYSEWARRERERERTLVCVGICMFLFAHVTAIEIHSKCTKRYTSNDVENIEKVFSTFYIFFILERFHFEDHLQFLKPVECIFIE